MSIRLAGMQPGQKSTILVTGATGNVGGAVARMLREKGFAPRLATRSVRSISDKGAVELDFLRKESCEAAVQGVTSVFLMRPPQLAKAKDFAAFLAAAKSAGVQRLVFLSLLGAEKNPFMPHAKIEKLIVACGLPYTFLRAGFFMQNLSTTHAKEIRECDEILVPAGAGRTAFVDVEDIAEVAVKHLVETTPGNRAFSLTGAEAITYSDVAEILTRVLGRKIRYARPSIARFAIQMRKRGFPLGMIAVMIAIYSVARAGRAARITSDLEEQLGRAPTRFSEFAFRNRGAW